MRVHITRSSLCSSADHKTGHFAVTIHTTLVTDTSSLLPSEDIFCDGCLSDNELVRICRSILSVHSPSAAPLPVLQKRILAERSTDFTVSSVFQTSSYPLCMSNEADNVSLSVTLHETVHEGVSLIEAPALTFPAYSSSSVLGKIIYTDCSATDWLPWSNMPDMFAELSLSSVVVPVSAVACPVSFSLHLTNLSCTDTLSFSYKVQKNFLVASQFPPDASFGSIYPPTAASVSVSAHGHVSSDSSSSSGGMRGIGGTDHWVVSNSLVFTRPIPDQTMPYNVITMVIRLISLVFLS